MGTKYLPAQVITGGQTGVDRGALDAALELGIDAGGWCPLGRAAEDGQIPDRYPMQELDSTEYRDRTRRNVEEADATLILCRGALVGGTALTATFCRSANRPFLVADPGAEQAAGQVRRWLDERKPRILNVAGPRESEDPGIQAICRIWLVDLLSSGEGRGAHR